MEDVIKPIKLPLMSSWELFQYHVAEKIGCHEMLLKLGYKLSIERAAGKPHSLETLDEYEGMQEEFLLELNTQAATLRKKTKKTSRLDVVCMPLKVSIIDRCSWNEKKVRDLQE